jgi:hypothetical protein
MYVVVCTRPYLAQVVNVVSKYMTNPGRTGMRSNGFSDT